MATTRDALAYLVVHYPHKGELSKARATKMVYLADWRSSLVHGHQITPVQWIFNHYGPYVDAVTNSARGDSALDVVVERNLYGGPKERIVLRKATGYPSLTEQDTEIMNYVITTCAPLNWDDFMRLVYSTYPVMTQPKRSTLNLPLLARQYLDAKRGL